MIELLALGGWVCALVGWLEAMRNKQMYKDAESRAMEYFQKNALLLLKINKITSILK